MTHETSQSQMLKPMAVARDEGKARLDLLHEAKLDQRTIERVLKRQITSRVGRCVGPDEDIKAASQ